jgi:hypothetical protein
VTAWLNALLAERGVDILRAKGILDIKGEARRLVFQAVHMMLEGDLQRPWRDDERRWSRAVFIGRNLDEAELRRGFRGLAPPERDPLSEALIVAASRASASACARVQPGGWTSPPRPRATPAHGAKRRARVGDVDVTDDPRAAPASGWTPHVRRIVAERRRLRPRRMGGRQECSTLHANASAPPSWPGRSERGQARPACCASPLADGLRRQLRAARTPTAPARRR